MKSALPFVRQNRIRCGKEWLYVELFQYTEEQRNMCRKKRKKREKLTPPKQIDLNEKRARRYFVQLANANFQTGIDLKLDLTYAPGNIPVSLEEDERNVRNFLRRINYARKKAGLEPAKRIWVPTGGQISARTGKPTKIHHHILISGGMDRDEIEKLWKLGTANCDRLQDSETGCEAFSRYIFKQGNRLRRWRPSKNLEKPIRTSNDNKYSIRKLRRICESGEVFNPEYWEKSYPGFRLAGASDMAISADAPDEFNSNWRVYAKLRRLPERKNRKKGRKTHEISQGYPNHETG